MDDDNVSLRGKVFDYDARRLSHDEDERQSHVGYYDFSQMMQTLLDDNAYAVWKQAFNASIEYWDTTEMNYSQFAGMFSMKETNGVTHYIPLSLDSQAAAAYRSTAWYTAAGLDKMGW